MRYILDSNGYVESVSCTPFFCNNKGCTEYTGNVPEGYSSLEEWATTANVRAYKVVSGQLVYDSAKDTELQNLYKNQSYTYSTTEQKIGTWINGKPIYRKVIDVPASSFTSTYVSTNHGISNLDTVISVKGNWYDSQGYCWRSMPSSYHASSDWSSQILIKNSEVVFEIGSSASTRIQTKATNVYVTIEYTKTTD